MALTVLLVDTDETRARALEEKLSGFARVIRAEGTDMAAAVERAKPDLVIVDMELPDRDALEDIRAVSGGSPVVMFAGTDDPGFAQEAIAAAALFDVAVKAAGLQVAQAALHLTHRLQAATAAARANAEG